VCVDFNSLASNSDHFVDRNRSEEAPNVIKDDELANGRDQESGRLQTVVNKDESEYNS
jgi:hypothetical protein